MNSQPAPVDHDNEYENRRMLRPTMVHYMIGFVVLMILVVLMNHIFRSQGQKIQYGGGPILNSSYSPANLSDVPTIYSLME